MMFWKASLEGDGVDFSHPVLGWPRVNGKVRDTLIKMVDGV